jgi:hypothetical protein
MDRHVIYDKYEVTDTLFSNELQTIYTAKTTGTDGDPQFIVNEFKNTDIIYSMKDSFSPEKCHYIKNLVETFYLDFNFYVVSNICAGPTLEDFLSDNSLRLTEKMYIVDSLLKQLAEMQKLGPVITYALCNTSNLAITGRKNICFNCNIVLSHEDMSLTNKDVVRRTGEILCAIFANTVDASLESAKDVLPPAMLPIVQRCLEGNYDSVSNVYFDFKSLLIYSVFMGNMSVDNQVRKNFEKAQIKRRLSPIKRIAVCLVLIAALWFAWPFIRDSKSAVVINPEVKNTKPIASIEASKREVYAGDSVVFISKVTDPDAEDSVKSYFWAISKDNEPIFNSTNQNIAYTFANPGNYNVLLVVTDSRDESSEPHNFYLAVVPKPKAGSESSIPSASDRK